MPSRFDFSSRRAAWLSRHILPHEAALRAHLFRWWVPDDLEVDDVIQETYTRLAMLADVDDIRNPRAYFFQIARSVILGHVRRSRVVSIQAMGQMDELGIASDEPGPDVQVADRQQLSLLAAMIAALPKINRTAVTLKFVHELSHREIGERLGMTPNAVQKCLAKSLSTFIRRLGRGVTDAPRASRDQVAGNYQSGHGETRNQFRD